MAYDKTTFDFARLRRFATHVAATRRETPCSTLHVRSTETRTVTRLLLWNQTVEVQVQATRDLPGWILLVAPHEGSVSHMGGQGDSRFEGREFGRLLLLTCEGVLHHADYSIWIRRHFGRQPDYTDTRITEERVATRDDVLSFDPTNLAGYRETRKRSPQHGGSSATTENWRRELEHNWRVGIPHAGMKASLALKSYKEHGSYVPHIEIHF